MYVFLILYTRKSPINNSTLSTTATMQNVRFVLKQKESIFRFGCIYETQRGAPVHAHVHRPMVMYLHTKSLRFWTYKEKDIVELFLICNRSKYLNSYDSFYDSFFKLIPRIRIRFHAREN